ncbi:unnamed protein product, partial [Ixodes persulcatus]
KNIKLLLVTLTPRRHTRGAPVEATWSPSLPQQTSSTKSLGLLPADKRSPPSSSVGFMAKLENADGKWWQLQIDFVELAVNVSTHETPFFPPHVRRCFRLLSPRPQTSSEFSSF